MENNRLKSDRTKQLYKSVRLLIAGMFLGVLLPGCTDFLRGEPEISFTTETYYTDTVKLSMGALGIYESLASQGTYGNVLIVLDSGDDLICTTSLRADASGISPEQVACYNISDNSGYTSGIWTAFYRGVKHANTLIANSGTLLSSPNQVVRQVTRKYVAEAKVLRAYYYLELVRRWGDIPLRTEATTIANSHSARSPQEEIYALIIKDLKESIVDLPWHDEDATMNGRINKGTVMGLLVRAYLFAGGYSLHQDGTIHRPDNYLDYYREAEIYSRELISSGKHALNPDYKNIFYNLCQNVREPKESMFEVDFAYTNGNDVHASRVGSYTIGVAISGNDAIYNNTPRIFTHYWAYSKYEESDLRRGINIANYSLIGMDFTEKPIPNTTSNKWGIGKWRRDWHSPAPTHRNYTDINYPLLRYTEVLLMRAEILNELNGPTEEAVELVNQVRRRGYGMDIHTPSRQVDVPAKAQISKEVFFNFLTEEYAREFLGESGRKLHLLRWNLLKEKLGEVGDFFDNPANYRVYHDLKCQQYGGYLARRLFTTGKHELWPIPYVEVTESNGMITENNPGYN